MVNQHFSMVVVDIIYSLLSKGLTVIILFYLLKIFRNAYIQRKRVRSLAAQGIPIATHSLFFGHLGLFGDFRQAHPPDVNIHVFHTWLATTYKKYFPGLEKIPPVVYLDLWPLGPSFALVYDATAIPQFTQAKVLPKFNGSVDFMEPLTSNLDIVTTEGKLWKTWRSRFNPGFGSRNIIALLPELVEEVSVFADVLKSLADKDHGWGPVFQLKEKASNLTFDIICRVTLDMQFHQQTSKSDIPLKKAYLDQLNLMSLQNNSARGILHRKMPWHRMIINKNNRVMHDLIKPFIDAKLHSDGNDTNSQAKTVVGLAIHHINKSDSPDLSSRPTADSQFINILISNIKAFMFAGQDTTTSTICFMFKFLQDNPQCLERLRAEHDEVLGSNPEDAAKALVANPHFLYNLPYTLGVAKETLRLCPLAAPAKEPSAELCLTVPNSEIRYPLDGFAPWIAMGGIQRSPDYWEHPTEFLPERWMASEGDPLYPRKDAWIPFSIGPRNCIGIELALAELRLVCVFVARTFDIGEAWDDWDKKQGDKATPSHKINGQRLYECDNGPVQPKDGMPVHVRLRKQPSKSEST